MRAPQLSPCPVAVAAVGSRSPLRQARCAGFTLVEIVIVMTILAVLAAASIPSFRGLQRERAAREPIAALIDMAKEARLRAMKEKRPYQIALTAQGFTGTRYFDPYLTLAGLEEFILQATPAEELATPETEEREADPTAISLPPLAPTISDTASAEDEGDNNSTSAATLPKEPEWIARSSWPTGAKARAQIWHRVIDEGVYLEGEDVTLWVFQPSGIVEMLILTLKPADGGHYQVQFGGLNADPVYENSSF
jgi:prepilin-type N-terminal cleavage/methylation domain-containing protein